MVTEYPIQIDHNISIPIRGKKGRKAGNCKYPFTQMKVGDSFFMPCQKGLEDMVGRRLRAAVEHRINPYRIAVTVRNVEGGVRCWRTK